MSSDASSSSISGNKDSGSADDETSRYLAWDAYAWSDDVRIHATLMLIGWGFFIPLAVLTNTHLSYRSKDRGRNNSSNVNNNNNKSLHKFGIYYHMYFASIGIIFVLSGFGFALSKFTTLGYNPQRINPVPMYNKAHAILGCVTIGGIVVQLVCYMLMRSKNKSKPNTDENDNGNDGSGDNGQQTQQIPEYKSYTWYEKIGHFGHRGLGYLWLLLAFITMEMGTHITSIHRPAWPDLAQQNLKYSAGYIGTLVAMSLSVAITVHLALRYFNTTTNNNNTNNDDEQSQVQQQQQQEVQEPPTAAAAAAAEIDEAVQQREDDENKEEDDDKP